MILYNNLLRGDIMLKHINKRLLTLILTGGIALSTIGCSTSNFPLEKYDEVPSGVEMDMVEVSDSDYHIKEDKSTSIIYQTSAKTYGDIYKDVDVVKDIISKYDIKTVYLDLDSLFTDDYGTSLAVAKAFLDKCGHNRIHVGIIGSREIYNILGTDLMHYDSCLRVDEDTDIKDKSRKYFSFYDERDSKFYTNLDYDLIIERNNLNDPDNYVIDTVYTVQSGDSLYSIAKDYNISYTNLMRYNGLDDTVIYPGDEIIIPNDYKPKADSASEVTAERINEERTIETETREQEDSTETVEATDLYSKYKSVDNSIFYKGIDVSEHNGTIDWSETNDVVDFAIIRLADTYNRNDDGTIEVDSEFVNNIEACNELGIPVGVYIYSRATTEEEMAEEIRFVLDNVKKYNITLPIYRDLEGKYAEALVQSEEDRLNQVNLTIKFCEAMEGAGYPTGLYLHKKYLDCVPELMNKYSIWAQGGWLYSSKGMTFENMKYAYEDDNEIFDLTYTVNIYQPTECGSTDGLGMDECEYVDYDYVDQSFVDALIKKFDKTGNVKIKRN
jgi:LysM repeat protein